MISFFSIRFVLGILFHLLVFETTLLPFVSWISTTHLQLVKLYGWRGSCCWLLKNWMIFLTCMQWRLEITPFDCKNADTTDHWKSNEPGLKLNDFLPKKHTIIGQVYGSFGHNLFGRSYNKTVKYQWKKKDTKWFNGWLINQCNYNPPHW